MIHNNFRRIALAQGLLQAHPYLPDRPDADGAAPSVSDPRSPSQGGGYGDRPVFSDTDEHARDQPRQV